MSPSSNLIWVLLISQDRHFKLPLIDHLSMKAIDCPLGSFLVYKTDSQDTNNNRMWGKIQHLLLLDKPLVKFDDALLKKLGSNQLSGISVDIVNNDIVSAALVFTLTYPWGISSLGLASSTASCRGHSSRNELLIELLRRAFILLVTSCRLTIMLALLIFKTNRSSGCSWGCLHNHLRICQWDWLSARVRLLLNLLP